MDITYSLLWRESLFQTIAQNSNFCRTVSTLTDSVGRYGVFKMGGRMGCDRCGSGKGCLAEVSRQSLA